MCCAARQVNYGSVPKPLGGLDLQVDMKSYGKFESTTVGCHVIVKGDGSYEVVTCAQN